MSTAAWICDFMMRQAVAGPGPALLLLDEVEAHLHPLWQRCLLPAMRAALPGRWKLRGLDAAEGDDFLKPEAEFKLVLRQLLTFGGRPDLADEDRRRFEAR